MATRRDWFALGVLVLPVLLISIDMTVLGFALPFLAEDLAPSSAQQLWIVDIYSFVLAGLLVLMGTVGDRIGRRRLLYLGALAFGIASALAAYSTSAEMLIVARALLGLGGATLMPSTLSLIRNIFTDRAQRRLAIGIWSAAFSGGMALGPVVGGWLLEHFWWGSVFLINVPVMAVLLIALVAVPESRDPKPGKFDPLSAVLSLATLLPVIYGVKKMAEQQAVSLLPALSIVLGLAFGAAFVRRQWSLEQPMLDLNLFRERRFSVSVLTNMLGVFAMIGLLFLLPQYLQLVLGLSPMTAALWILPQALAAVLGALLAARLAQRFSVPALVGIGLLVAAAGFLAITQLGVDSGLAYVVVGFAVVGFGVALSETLTNDMIIATAPPARAGAASAISETGFELGGALGVALLGSLSSMLYRADLGALDGLSASASDAARETLGGAVAVADGVSGPAGAALHASASGAFVHSVQLTALVGAAILAYTGIQAMVLLRKKKQTGAGGVGGDSTTPDRTTVEA
ncbi:DHA2 family multidrug resistance protein-like MFS transporter [Tamaricihabitans halophyticus]|uniref:DHA2 family multidrug resistance protein-like MFS transporter n=1 Tax=Tamaricihabitans halophyticus TaxID=1262583 RepID=A0A4R2QY59_9PSEU|nr:MFS transporter [Tamaricihabitans halophyticus]TCP54109.1 DHA2 family multidrug resistance protein-like MFS transporter [Tamaricihabitans halophyticus]